MKYTILLAALLVSVRMVAYGEAPAASLLTEPPPQSAKLNEIFNFTAKEGYHFNVEAPQACGAGEAFDVSTASLKCQFMQSGEQAVSLKLCAEKSPLCLFEEFTVTVEGPGGGAKAASVADAPALEPPLPGFVLNTPDAALRQAAKEGKLLFIDFFGKWCPSCRLMDDTALVHPAFLEASAGMVRLSLDIDLPEAREWLTRFRVSSYPTYVITDSRLREIGRLAGSLSPEAFTVWVREQESWKDKPIGEAKTGALFLGEAGKMRVAKAYIGEKKWALARQLLGGIKTRTARYLEAACLVNEAEASGANNLAELYRNTATKFDGSDGEEAEIGVVDWIAALQKLDPAAAKPWLDAMDDLAARLTASRAVIEEGYAPADVYITIADALSGAGLTERADDFYFRAAAEYAAAADKVARPQDAKGLRMNHARNLSLAHRYEKAAAAYAALTEQFPDEYAFHRSYAGTLRKLKKYPQAQHEAELAANLAYGDIRLDILFMKAEIEMEQKDKAQALKTLNEAIASVELPGDAKLRTHGAFRRLKNLRKEVENSN